MTIGRLCLKENVVPKSVKLNFKQFKQLNEYKILCKTHHQNLNSRVRKTNRTIDKISKDIESLRSNIKTKVSSPHFKSITDVIYKSKENLFKKVKQKSLNISKSHQHTSTRAHLQEMGYQPCQQGSITRQSQITSKRSKIHCIYPKGACYQVYCSY